MQRENTVFSLVKYGSGGRWKANLDSEILFCEQRNILHLTSNSLHARIRTEHTNGRWGWTVACCEAIQIVGRVFFKKKKCPPVVKRKVMTCLLALFNIIVSNGGKKCICSTPTYNVARMEKEWAAVGCLSL